MRPQPVHTSSKISVRESLVADAADLGGVFGWIKIDAAFALDRFHDDAGDLGIEGILKGPNASGLDVDEAGNQGSETLADGGIAGRGDHRQGAAVKAFAEGDDLPSFWRKLLAAQAGQLAGGFVGFETAVTEKCLAGKCEAIQSFGELDLGLRVIRVADVPEFFRLGRRGLDQCGMAMTENRAAETGEEIEVLFSIGIPKIGAAAARHDDRLAGVIADEDFRGTVENLLRLRHKGKNLKSETRMTNQNPKSKGGFQAGLSLEDGSSEDGSPSKSKSNSLPLPSPASDGPFSETASKLRSSVEAGAFGRGITTGGAGRDRFISGQGVVSAFQMPVLRWRAACLHPRERRRSAP